jgi:hypothetical protein
VRHRNTGAEALGFFYNELLQLSNGLGTLAIEIGVVETTGLWKLLASSEFTVTPPSGTLADPILGLTTLSGILKQHTFINFETGASSTTTVKSLHIRTVETSGVFNGMRSVQDLELVP